MEALVNFQTMVCDLTAMPISNASMLDEATAAAEAMTLALRVGKSESTVLFVANNVLPQTIEVIQTRGEPLGLQVKVGPSSEALQHDSFALLLQYPGVDGEVASYQELISAYKAKGGLVIMAADLLALTLLTPPGELGADIVVGNTQRFGMPMGAGGPHAAYLACKDEYKRSMPGRLVGISIDTHGNPSYPTRIANTRAAHSSGKSDIEYLYSASFASSSSQYVCGVSRPRGFAAYCGTCCHLHRCFGTWVERTGLPVAT
jgi:glycine dehydrogenase